MRGRVPPGSPARRSPGGRRGPAGSPAAPRGKVVLAEESKHPLCPWCGARLERILWHKIRGGPALAAYTIVLSCSACRGVLEALAGGDSGAGVV